MTDGISGENHVEYNEKEADRLGENTRTAGYIYAQRDSDRNSWQRRSMRFLHSVCAAAGGRMGGSMQKEWRSFKGGAWEREINVRDFIQKNYTPYDGDGSFLEGPTQDTSDLWEQVLELSKQEREAGGVLDMDTQIISTITSHGPGYLNKEKEKIVGFQTDKPFKRALQPYGGIRIAVSACEDNGYHVDPEVVEIGRASCRERV